MTADERQALLQEKAMLAENFVLYTETGDRRLRKTTERIDAIKYLLSLPLIAPDPALPKS